MWVKPNFEKVRKASDDMPVKLPDSKPNLRAYSLSIPSGRMEASDKSPRDSWGSLLTLHRHHCSQRC